MATFRYFFTNTQGKHDISTIINSGNNEIAGLKFKNFPKSQIIANYTWFKQINGGNLNYSVNGVDVANNINCGAEVTDYYPAGSHTVPVPVWATQISFVLVGAGGGGGTGGRGSNDNNGSGGAGGGSGAVLISNTIPLFISGSNRTLSLTVGAGGLGGVRTLRNNIANDGTNSGTNGGNGGNTTIIINSVTYIARGGGGGQNGYNISADTGPFAAVPANGGNGGTYVMPYYRQTAQNGVAAVDGELLSDGSPGTDGGDISVNPINNYYLPITSTGGAGGIKASNGTNPGGLGSDYGGGGGGGGGSTASGGDFGGAGGAGGDGTARFVFYP